MNLELYVFNMCPYCQRVRVVLNHMGIPHQLHRLDPANKPEGFTRISPLGTVPALRVDDQATVLDAVVVNDYLNQIGGGGMLPGDPLASAVLRGWIAVFTELQGDMMKVIGAASEQALDAVVTPIHRKLVLLEQLLAQGILPAAPHPLNLLDAVMAPLFQRWAVIHGQLPLIDPATLPRVHAWQAWLLGEPAVIASVDGDFPELFRRFIRQRGADGVLAKRMGEGG